MVNIPILVEATPAGDYVLETNNFNDNAGQHHTKRLRTGWSVDLCDDANHLCMDLYANSDTRQVEFIKGETPEGIGYPTWSATDLGGATNSGNLLTTWVRLAKRTIDGTEVYTGYSSVDGSTWVRCAVGHTRWAVVHVWVCMGAISPGSKLYSITFISTVQ